MPILFPVNATGHGGQEQLNVLSYSNIDSDTEGNRYYAHALVAWVYYGFVMYLIFRECLYFINLRQAFLISPFYGNRVSSRTVLFLSVPEPYLDERALRKVFGNSVQHIWITGVAKDIEKLVAERDKVALKLEKAEVKLIKLANKERIKALKGASADDQKTQPPLDAESGSIAARWVPTKKRPSHRTGLLGLIGKKVDTIDWCRSELTRLIPETEAAQANYLSGGAKKVPAVFIEFKSQAEAETALQVVPHHAGLQMSPRHIGIRPQDVVWSSLTLPWWQRLVRRYAVLAFISALIIFWAVPVAVVGVISNVDSLETLSFLTWLKKIPTIIMGVVTGLLPSVALSILMSLVPIIMRLCARMSGEPSLARVELFTQNAYFAFQVIQVFLITTVTSSASAVAEDLAKNPTGVTGILANNLPKASNFYISYFIVQGFSVSASVISQVTGFVIFTLMYKYLAGTPRALYKKWANLSGISWGSTLPVYTNIVVIAITYAAIAPLVLAWATIAMSLFYFAWRYKVLFVTDTELDTRGLIYPRAIKQLFTGIYLSELCMIGLFGASVAIGPLVLMVIFLIFTVLFHISLNAALNPLLYNLPQSLMAEEEQRRLELASSISNEKNATNGTVPLLHAHDTPKKSNFLVRFLKPWVYADYFRLRSYLPQTEVDFGVTEQLEAEAYLPPSVTAQPPLLWLPRDQAGVSSQEVAHTGKILPITDEGCELNDKNKIEWDQDGARPPLWEPHVIY
ncbi:phosphate metabolism protein 7 [Cytospora paraplurivora]|uniref:Phosphate metabolism protein 7 n=1 Tax=Cytospora paraplurivora TaxID=2898453 RepID=A0AAN9ULF0_9PEZI